MGFWIVFILSVFFLMVPFRLGPDMEKPKELQYIGVFLIACVALLRFDVGYDYPAYYHNLWPSLEINEIERYEFICKQFFFWTYSVQWPPLLFMLFDVVIYGFTFYSLKKYTPNLFLATLTFIAFFYLNAMGVIRQGAAMAIVLYCYKYIEKFNFIKYFFWILIASAFHSSAIIALCIPFIYKYFNYKLLIIASIVLFSSFSIVEYVINTYMPFYNLYLIGIDSMSGGNIIKYVYVILNLMLFFFARHHKREIYPLLYISSLGAIFPFIFGGHIGGRIANYFLIFLCISIPKIFNYYSYKMQIRVGAILCSFFLALLYVSVGNSIKSPYTPYQTIFSINYSNPKFKRY